MGNIGIYHGTNKNLIKKLVETYPLSISQACKLLRDRKKTTRLRYKTVLPLFLFEKKEAILNIKPCTAPAISRNLKKVVPTVSLRP